MNPQKDNRQIIIYQSKNRGVELQVRVQDETVWLTQKQIAELFGVNVPAISKHIRDIFKEEELEPSITVSKMETVQKEKDRLIQRVIEFYNLDMIISVGYRVNSTRATQFRIWATQRLKKYLLDGFVINQKRLQEKQFERLKGLEQAAAWWKPLLVCALWLFLLIPQNARAATPDIIITEIGAYEATGHEWVEIHNRGSEMVDLTGWVFWEEGVNHRLTLKRGAGMTLAPGEYAVITQDDVNFVADYAGVTAKIFDSSWGTLKESGEEIGLKDGGGVFSERFTYIVAENFSLERKDVNRNEYTADNWREHPDGNTVGRANSAPQNNQQGSDNNQSLTSAIVINEIVSNPNDEEQEWIELYNTESASVDLTGWMMEDGVGVIATLSNAVAPHGFLVVELSSSKLNNTGDRIILKNATGVVIDQITYGAWDDGTTSDNALNPAKGQSIGRVPDGVDTNVDKTDWIVRSQPTKGITNGAASSVSTSTTTTSNTSSASSSTSPSSNSGGRTEGVKQAYQPGDIVINELVPDPADNEAEFIELYSRFGRTIDLREWWLEDGSETKTNLSGTIDPHRFVVIEKPKGNLNNAGDLVVLFDPAGNTIDRVAYGDWNDGKVADNAPRADDPMSLARLVDGQDTDIDTKDFAVTLTITKEQPNIISRQGEITKSGNGETARKEVMLNELFPNPKGGDQDDEFVELFNNSSSSVEIGGWQLRDETTTYDIPSGTIAPSAYLVLKRVHTRLALNNSGGETVTLLSRRGTVVDEVRYADTAKEGESYARDARGVWRWTPTTTPGRANVIETHNQPPEVVIVVEEEVEVGALLRFDASDTRDPDGDRLELVWDFGDAGQARGEEVAHVFQTSGKYQVVLTVHDGHGHEVKERAIITVHESAARRALAVFEAASSVIISEIFPNPVGRDDDEFIELLNPSDRLLDLSGFSLDDDEHGSRPYRFPAGTQLLPRTYRVFTKEDTTITLNNTSDRVRLLSPDGSLIAEVFYDDVIEGASYARGNTGTWQWTEEVTPGEANVIKTLKHATALSGVPPAGGKNVKAQRASSSGRSRSVSTREISLGTIREFDPGDKVTVTGTVAVLPGILGSQFFYITAQGEGVQVYQHKKDFPQLALGDSIRVAGELSEAYGERRVKVAKKNDITVIALGELSSPIALTTAEIGEANEGALVSVEGEITEKHSLYLYLDDGSGEVRVYLRSGTGIEPGQFQPGKRVKITGIVSERNGEYRLLPRSPHDIVVATGIETLAATGDVIKERDITETYLTATAGGLTSIVIGLLARARGALALGFVKRIGRVALAMVRKRG